MIFFCQTVSQQRAFAKCCLQMLKLGPAKNSESRRNTGAGHAKAKTVYDLIGKHLQR